MKSRPTRHVVCHAMCRLFYSVLTQPPNCFSSSGKFNRILAKHLRSTFPFDALPTGKKIYMLFSYFFLASNRSSRAAMKSIKLLASMTSSEHRISKFSTNSKSKLTKTRFFHYQLPVPKKS